MTRLVNAIFYCKQTDQTVSFPTDASNDLDGLFFGEIDIYFVLPQTS